MEQTHDRVLAVYPTRTGFGWVLFEKPARPADWGVVAVARDRNMGCLARIDEMIGRFEPSSLVLEEFEGPVSRRNDRIRQLGRAVIKLADATDVPVYVYSRADIGGCFEEAGAVTRYEIATAIAARIEALAHLLPPKRKIWMPEDPRMGLFDAAAVALAHYRLNGTGEYL
jgi:hypothetical protein